MIGKLSILLLIVLILIAFQDQIVRLLSNPAIVTILVGAVLITGMFRFTLKNIH